MTNFSNQQRLGMERDRMVCRHYRVMSPSDPSVVVIRLRGVLKRNPFSKGLMLDPGEEPQIDERGFRFRLAENRLGRTLVTGTVRSSGSESEIVFDLAQSLENLWVLGVTLPPFSAVLLIGFWPISFVLAIGSTLLVWALMAFIILLGFLVTPSLIGQTLVNALSATHPRPLG